MSPEEPGSLVVVDAQFVGKDLIGKVERIWSTQFLTVTWYALKQPEGSLSVGGGAAYVYDAANAEKGPLTEVAVQKPVDRYRWRDTARGDGLMFILVLPKGYSIKNPEPMLREAKTFGAQERLAVYWKPEGMFGADVEISWELETISTDLEAALSEVNRMILDATEVPSNIGVNVKETTAEVKIALKDLLAKAFNISELNELLFELEVDEGELPVKKSGKIREMILYLDRRGRLDELVAQAKLVRPRLLWPELDYP